jgi:hypothetical protein
VEISLKAHQGGLPLKGLRNENKNEIYQMTTKNIQFFFINNLQ